MARNYNQEEVYQKPFDSNQFKRLLIYLRPYTKQLFITLSIMLILSLADLAGPLLMQQAIDGAIVDKNLNQLHLIGIAYLALRLTMFIGSYFRTIIMNKTGQGVIYDMRKQLYNHIQHLSLRFYDSRPAGKIMVRITSDIENLNELLTSGVVQVINDMLTLVLIIAIMVKMHALLALYTFAIVPLLILLATKLRTYVRKNWRIVRRKRSNMNAFLQESISGMRTIQAFTHEAESGKEFDDVNQDYTLAQLAAVKVSMLFGPSVELTGAIGTCIVYYAGARLVVGGNISTGVLVAFISYVGRFWEPISRLSNFYNQLLVAMASAERVFTILDEEPEIMDVPTAEPIPEINGQVDFENVKFAYEEGVDVLKGISFHVEPGQTIALVGATGAGKSTIINLIPRFYNVLEGAIKIDGHNVRDIKKDSLRNQIGIVLQDPLIFAGTIRDNIRYGKLDATEAEIIAAAKAVNAHDFIIEFEKGYDTNVQERGSRLSVGQRQLVSFARAILANPRILILDEATSSIDTKTEQLIQDAIQNILKGRTSFVIAHRLSTIRNADKILVIENGEITECGTHESLLALQGIYYKLNKAQFSSFQKIASD